MNKTEKKDLLNRSKVFFIEKIAKPHLKNTKKLDDLSEFNVNPLLDRYLARFYSGRTDSQALAESLILPRVLGTSPTTTFGTQMQKFCGEVLQQGLGSKISGVDIEFKDAVDGRTKYCQVKSGPNTINNDDVTTIVTKYKLIKRLASTNSVKDLRMSDLCVGVLYGVPAELNASYRSLTNDYYVPVYIGKDFWHRLTGEPEFYLELAQAFADSVVTIDATQAIKELIKKLAVQIEARDGKQS